MRLPIVTMGISAVVIALYFIAGAIPETFIWHSAPSTQWWQWLSAHFVHISFDHLIWNVAALFILGSIIEQTSRIVLALSCLAGTIGVNLFLVSLFDMNAYAGLSGMLNALLITALYFLYKQHEYRTASIITLIGSLLKMWLECKFDLSFFTTLPWPAVPEAHLAGFLGGLVLVLFLEIRIKRLMKSDLVRFNS